MFPWMWLTDSQLNTLPLSRSRTKLWCPAGQESPKVFSPPGVFENSRIRFPASAVCYSMKRSSGSL